MVLPTGFHGRFRRIPYLLSGGLACHTAWWAIHLAIAEAGFMQSARVGSPPALVSRLPVEISGTCFSGKRYRPGRRTGWVRGCWHIATWHSGACSPRGWYLLVCCQLAGARISCRRYLPLPLTIRTISIPSFDTRYSGPNVPRLKQRYRGLGEDGIIDLGCSMHLNPYDNLYPRNE